MAEVATIGIDLAKRAFQAHGAAADGAVVFRRKVSRGRLPPFLAAWPGRVVTMEACGSAHDRAARSRSSGTPRARSRRST